MIAYFLMVRGEPDCETCSATGEIWIHDAPDDPDGDPVGCPTCHGTGHGPEQMLFHGSLRLYKKPGQAQGVMTREAKARLQDGESSDHRILILDTDACDEVDRGWSTERHFQHAENRMLFWTERAEAYRLRLEDETREPLSFKHRFDPGLTREDIDVIERVLDLHDRDRQGQTVYLPEHPDIEKVRDIHERLREKQWHDKMDKESEERARRVRLIVAEAEAAKKGPG